MKETLKNLLNQYVYLAINGQCLVPADLYSHQNTSWNNTLHGKIEEVTDECVTVLQELEGQSKGPQVDHYRKVTITSKIRICTVQSVSVSKAERRDLAPKNLPIPGH